jgi:hypothetical protein
MSPSIPGNLQLIISRLRCVVRLLEDEARLAGDGHDLRRAQQRRAAAGGTQAVEIKDSFASRARNTRKTVLRRPDRPVDAVAATRLVLRPFCAPAASMK